MNGAHYMTGVWRITMCVITSQWKMFQYSETEAAILDIEYLNDMTVSQNLAKALAVS